MRLAIDQRQSLSSQLTPQHFLHFLQSPCPMAPLLRLYMCTSVFAALNVVAVLMVAGESDGVWRFGELEVLH